MPGARCDSQCHGKAGSRWLQPREFCHHAAGGEEFVGAFYTSIKEAVAGGVCLLQPRPLDLSLCPCPGMLAVGTGAPGQCHAAGNHISSWHSWSCSVGTPPIIHPSEGCSKVFPEKGWLDVVLSPAPPLSCLWLCHAPLKLLPLLLTRCALVILLRGCAAPASCPKPQLLQGVQQGDEVGLPRDIRGTEMPFAVVACLLCAVKQLQEGCLGTAQRTCVKELMIHEIITWSCWRRVQLHSALNSSHFSFFSLPTLPSLLLHQMWLLGGIHSAHP